MAKQASQFWEGKKKGNEKEKREEKNIVHYFISQRQESSPYLPTTENMVGFNLNEFKVFYLAVQSPPRNSP